MNQLKELLADNEGWLKRHILEFAGNPDAESGWADFFSGLIDSAPQHDESESRLSGVFDSLDQPVLMLDEEGVVFRMNCAAVSLLGGEEGGRLVDMAPWLGDEVAKECARGKTSSAIKFDATRPDEVRDGHYAVTLAWDGINGWLLVLEDVTARVEAQQQLVSERNRASHYLDVVGAFVVVLDASGAVTMINDTCSRGLGYKMFELVGRNWVEAMVPKEQRDEVLDYLYLVFSEQVDPEGNFSYYVTTRNGEDRLIQWQHRLLANEGGMPIGVLASGVDVTEHRVIEDALAEKELWLRSTFVALGEAVLILTPERGVIDANPAAEVMFGMTNEELVNTPVVELHVDAVHNADFIVRCEEAFEKGERAMFEFPLRRKNGEIFPSEHSVSLIIGDDGNPLGIVNTIRDISARKRAEQVLKESEEKFRRIFETIEEGYIVTDLDGKIQMVNPATCRLLGYDAPELVGRGLDSLFQAGEGRPPLRAHLLKGETVRGMTHQAARKDGTMITVDANVHLIYDEFGNPVGIEGTFRDITKRIEAEKILREREQQYRAFFENNHAIMLLTDPKTEDIVDANPAASEFYGYEADEMREMNMSRINVLTQDEMFMEMQLAREEKRAYFIMQHKLSNGSLRDVEVYSGPIMVQGNQLLYSVIHDVTKRIILESEMKTLATTDALTGVDNRHQFFTRGSRELRRSQRYKKPLTLLMLDIDYFKSINDTYGHQAGDAVLQELARSATSMLRESDVFGRLGGEEFAVVLPETGLKLGREVAERLRKRLAKVVVEFEGKKISFTVSIGATLARRNDKIVEDVIKRADEGLYKAKRMGRNRVERG